MKFVFAFALIIAALACINADCDPDGNGQPDCTGVTARTVYRNFWDPTRYWVCSSGQLSSENCPINTGFLTIGGCVDWSKWDWVAPCPAA
ncbi:uncharacterized protein LOC119684354 [Teleopsis dalmanni]|uniref:uncharacterized protein LOC119684354 n=1 Tax=Teleopsis dalmanni TaxID=139649 RepID=UPI000D32BD97|nr:uncharacterized protein LOC119684354 [Teleopsis dalmanni]